MQRRFRQALAALIEHGCVSYAKIATISGFCDIDLIIVKATAPNDLPIPEKYIRELLKIFTISPTSCRTFSLCFTRRFGNTRSWRVALKCLILLHRLLRSVPQDSPFRSELLWTRTNGFISLYPCHFRDDSSSSAPEAYTIFIRSYSHLVDEALNCIFLDSKKSDQEEVPESLPEKVREFDRMLEFLPQLQSLIDRGMDCRPTGITSRSLIIQIAMKYVIRDSFRYYTTFKKEIVMVLDNLLQMPYRSCTAAFGIYKKAAFQANQLCEFYDWCKAKGLCGSYEYPRIDRIPRMQIHALENFLNGMWQLTEEEESSSSPTMSPSSSMESPSTLTEDDKCRWGVRRGCIVFKDHQFEEEEKPLIQFEDSDQDVSWENLLEASISVSPHPHQGGHLLGYYYNGCGYNEGYDKQRFEGKDGHENENNTWKMQIYKTTAAHNPFSQPYDMPLPTNNGRFVANPTYPWGL